MEGAARNEKGWNGDPSEGDGVTMSDTSYQPDTVRNLAGIQCPMNMVYAKVELAKLKPGQVLELILDDGAPLTNVSLSLEREGHILLGKSMRQDQTWSLFIRKGI